MNSCSLYGDSFCTGRKKSFREKVMFGLSIEEQEFLFKCKRQQKDILDRMIWAKRRCSDLCMLNACVRRL